MGSRADDDEVETKELDIRSVSSSSRQTHNMQYVHKVGVPPKQNLFKEFATTVKETFFADDPLRPFKDQPKSRKFILGIQAIFPILEWGRSYNLTKFKGDIIAGLTIASLCIPQGKKNRKLFWVPAIAPLISVILSTFFVYITRADKEGVQIVKHIERGINRPSVDKIFFTGPYVLKGFKIGAIAGMIGLTEAVAIGRTFASMKDYQLDGNKEMVALGAMNVVGSMTSCYVATGSFSRSAVNYMAGCQTALSNVIMSCVVFLTLKFITPLFKYTPNAILAAIIISAVVGLIDVQAAILIWKIDKFDFVACMGAFFGVVFASVEIGLLIAVSISFAKILLQVTRPRTAVLGKIPRTNVYRNILQYPEAVNVPGVLIVRVDSAIYFSNSNYVKESVNHKGGPGGPVQLLG
ncbi:hypothetical protein SLEP1_g20810 [Rubroshorea leprosula]|uniref:SLC26A/SulP transporter domain-containing protein n=1 Tax=Rubroshorea leprosula TaxID=152421 RepID=A0AAV5JEL4_9ROSI|nr:hypothetical protein SLEP1_g20810 [Rubroshorea leprosula]